MDAAVSYFTHRFEAEIVYHFVGTYRYTVVFLPEDMLAALPLRKHPRLRVYAEVADIPVEGAFQPVKGRWYLMVSKDVLKGAEISVGDVVDVRFIVVDQNLVEVPEALKEALARHDDARTAWDALSPGAQRGLAHAVSAAKTEVTRRRRVDTAIDRLLHPDRYSRTGKRIDP